MKWSSPSNDSVPNVSITACLVAKSTFNLQATVRLLQRRPANQIDQWQDGRYLRALPTPDGVRLIAVTNAMTMGAEGVDVAVLGGPIGDAVMRDLLATVRWMLGLDEPPAPTDWLAEQDPRLATVARVMRGFRPPCFPNLFETAASVIPFQQLSLEAGIAIHGRLIERFGERVTVAGRGWFAFPRPEVIAAAPLDALRAAGLTATKAASLRGLARREMMGELAAAQFAALPTDTALRELRTISGIGPWSAALILLRGLRRMDVFPPGDAGAARSLTAVLGHSSPMTSAEVNAFAARFGEYRGYLYFLCLGARWLAEHHDAPATGD